MSESISSVRPAGARLPRAERRVSVRYLCYLDTSCQVPTELGEKESWPASLCDISLEGFGLVLEQPVEAETVLGLDLNSPDRDLSYTLFGRVVHSRRLPDGTWLTGCALLRRLSAEELHELL